jgi:hypothetical protein
MHSTLNLPFHQLAVVLLVLVLPACAPQPVERLDTAIVRLDGLQEISSKSFDTAFVRPGVDFGRYRELLVNESELAFRTPDRSKQQFPLSEEQKERFRQLLDRQFAEELSAAKNFRLTDTPGAETLDLYVRVQDILATVPPRRVGGASWGGIALQARGEATLVIELRDSQSEEVLARVFDRRAVEGMAMAQKQDAPITRWEDVETLCKRWATTVRSRLDVLVGGQY